MGGMGGYRTENERIDYSTTTLPPPLDMDEWPYSSSASTTTLPINWEPAGIDYDLRQRLIEQMLAEQQAEAVAQASADAAWNTSELARVSSIGSGDYSSPEAKRVSTDEDGNLVHPLAAASNNANSTKTDYVPTGGGFDIASWIQNYQSPSMSFDQQIRDMYGGLRDDANAASISRLEAIAAAAGIRGEEITSALGVATDRLGETESGRIDQVRALQARQQDRQNQMMASQALRESQLAQIAESQGGGGRPEIAAVQALMGGQMDSQMASNQSSFDRLSAIGDMAAADRSASLGGLGVEARDALAGDRFAQENQAATALESLLSNISSGEQQALLGEQSWQREQGVALDAWKRNALLQDMTRQQAEAAAAARQANADASRQEQIDAANAALGQISQFSQFDDFVSLPAAVQQGIVEKMFAPEPPTAEEIMASYNQDALSKAYSDPTVAQIIALIGQGHEVSNYVESDVYGEGNSEFSFSLDDIQEAIWAAAQIPPN